MSELKVQAFVDPSDWRREDAPGPFVRLSIDGNSFDVQTFDLPRLLARIDSVARPADPPNFRLRLFGKTLFEGWT